MYLDSTPSGVQFHVSRHYVVFAYKAKEGSAVVLAITPFTCNEVLSFLEKIVIFMKTNMAENTI